MNNDDGMRAYAATLPVPEVAQCMHLPRALYAQFPRGRPLGKPLDPVYQRGVLEAAFELFKAPEGPVLETIPT